MAQSQTIGTAVAAADRRVLDERFPAARPRLVGICRSLVGDAAEDVVQETYLQALRRIGQLRDEAALEAWLTTIAVRQCIVHQRRRRAFLDRLHLIPRRLAAPTSDLALRELIEQLPARERTVLVLHHGHGYSLAEVAELLGLTHTNARSIAARTRRRLLEQYKEADR